MAVAVITSERPAAAQEKPQNGVAGLKHWRYDMPSGFMVALISLPFSMGIAIASGAPPICGIVSAIIAGFILPFLGGSYVTISGPAAGLAPALFAGIMALGNGDVAVGYPRVLVAICIAGLLQVILAQCKVARLSAIFPAAAVEGMLAAIGLLIIVKQIPLIMGVKFQAHEFWEMLEEVPQHVSAVNLQVFGLGVSCIALLFILATARSRFFRMVPPPVWVFIGGTVVAQLVLGISGSFLISVPNPLEKGLILPDFQSFADSSLWLLLTISVVTLLLIDGTESLATIAAVDKLDPFRRKSDPDRTLLAMGVSNFASSLFGGLTIIPGIVKSTANTIGGGRTQWANFYNACFLLLFLVFMRPLINMVPYCILASILIFVGFKLCRPRVWKHVWSIGKEQFVIFAATVLITVSTDLLIGIFAGVLICLFINGWHALTSHAGDGQSKSMLAHLLDFFRNPVGSRECADGTCSIYFTRSLVCFNLFHLMRELEDLPPDVRSVDLHITDQVRLLDHTTCECLLQYIDDHNAQEGKPALALRGLERMKRLSSYESCTRLAQPTMVAEAAVV